MIHAYTDPNTYRMLVQTQTHTITRVDTDPNIYQYAHLSCEVHTNTFINTVPTCTVLQQYMPIQFSPCIDCNVAPAAKAKASYRVGNHQRTCHCASAAASMQIQSSRCSERVSDRQSITSFQNSYNYCQFTRYCRF